MLRFIYSYELKSLLKQPATYFYCAVLFALAIVTMLGTGGFFDGLPESDHEVKLINSAHEINLIFQYFNKLFLFLLPAIIGMVIYKDYKNNIFPILYSYPVRKSDYLLGKLFSSLTVVLLITLTVGIALYLGELILGQDNPMIGPTRHFGYASVYFFFVGPNMFVFGLLIFSIVASLRNIYAGFIAIILLFFIQTMTNNLFEDSPVLFMLLDPFGQNAVAYETRFWTISEQNELQIPVLGMVLWNRLFWMTLSLIFFGFFYKKFQLEQESFRLFPNRLKSKTASISVANSVRLSNIHTKTTVDFSFPSQVFAMLKLSFIDFRYIVKNWIFHVLVLFAVLALVFAMSRVTNRTDVTFLPLTRIVLSVPMLFYSIVIILLTFLYAGMLIHRSRMAKTNQLIDTTATSNWVLLGSKILALFQVQFLLLFLMILCGVGLQRYNGYYQFEIDLYLFHLFIITLPTLMIWAVLSVSVHTVVPNLYLSLFLLLLLWIGKDQLPQFGIETYLLRFNSPPQLVYSDLNGYGHGLSANYIINAYWLTFSALLMIASYLFWERGYMQSLKDRFQKAVKQLDRFVLFSLLVFLGFFCFLGYRIHKEEKSPVKVTENNKHLLEEFKANFGTFKSAIQPKITSVKLSLDIYPESNSFHAHGSYVIVNKTTLPIDTLLIKTGFDEITEYLFDVPTKVFRKDDAMQFAVHILETPIEPRDSIRMEFKIKNKLNTLFYQNSSVLQNGTFLRADILPRLGYFFETENKEPDDSLSRYTNFYSPDADLVEIETMISTHQSQTAIAPGILQKQWTENSRNHFHFKTEEKIKFAFAFNSGDYSIEKTRHKGVNLEIYHHKNHNFNLNDMFEGLKASLDYHAQYFSPYSDTVAKIIEFPHTEGTYSSIMHNAIPTSEVNFILRNGFAKNQVNLSFYVQAHELTHHWWGNRVMPANALGAKMLSESITEYISLNIYEQYFGQEKAQHFLSLQRQRYLEGRTKEAGKESPLYLVNPEQEYIAYGKGAMAFNALQYFIGEKELNKLLKNFLETHQFSTDQYPTSTDLLTHLKKNVPVEFHYIIMDMMETVTFYENRIIDVQKLPENQLEITFSIQKMDHTQKNEIDFDLVFLIIGQYDRDKKLLQTEIVKASSGSNNITISRIPGATNIQLDPFLHFIELNIEDNRRMIEH